MRKCFAAILLSVCSLAQALTINFDGLAAGSSPGDTYASQGVRFIGGTIVVNEFGPMLSGHTTMLVDPSIVGRGISLLADADNDDTPSLVCGTFCESMHIPTTRIPSGVINPRIFPDGTLFGSVVRDEYGGINRIEFNTRYLDSIAFDWVARQPNRFLDGNFGAGGSGAGVITGEVPEPSGALIFLVGALMLAGWKNQRSLHPVQNRA